jgi:phosphate transport system protein
MVGKVITMPEAPQHLVRSYEQDLNQLRNLIADMGAIVESQVGRASLAVIDRNAETAKRAVEADCRVDTLERDIERFAIRLLALRQPMAGDLRLIIGGLKVSDDLERIGDYASNIAKRATVLAQARPSFCLAGLAHMADLVRQNLHSMVAALRDADAAVAAEVWGADQAVDDMYNVVFRELMTYMLEDSRNIAPCTHLLFVARNLERIGDHTTNVAETMYYAATGEELPSPRPKTESDIYLP